MKYLLALAALFLSSCALEEILAPPDPGSTIIIGDGKDSTKTDSTKHYPDPRPPSPDTGRGVATLREGGAP
jgi:hypothetical protein